IVNAVSRVVSSLEQRLNIKLIDVFVSVSGFNVRATKNSCYRFIREDELIKSFDLEQLLQDSYRIVLQPDEKILHVVPQDYAVDHERGVKKPIGYSGQRLEGNFHVIIGMQSDVRKIEKCIEKAGLRLNGLIFSPLASAEAVLSDEEKEAGVVMVDIGAGTTDLALFQDGVLRYSAVIPFGGNVVTNDIKEGCGVLQKHAEKMKTQFGSAMGTMAREDAVVTIPGISGWEPKEIAFKSLACIIQARMEEIIELIMHHIERSGYFEKLGAGIVFTGGGAMLKHLSDLTKLKTGFDVRIGSVSRAFSSEEEQLLKVPLYSTAAGLLISAGKYPGSRITREQELFDDVEKEEQPVSKSDRKKKNVSKNKKPKRDKLEYITGDLFSRLAGMFEEKDTEM
ncbi:cell division protein FtsA, partial [Marinilabilia sp.]|uniref:cell division protein FtsA n=1 Tax=Marinilabilia sp. TaxID=2021252 RepID=UPI0025B9FC1E